MYYSCLPAAAVTTGAVPPLNGDYNFVSRATFQAGGTEWTYRRKSIGTERLECAGPLSTNVHIQVRTKDKLMHDILILGTFVTERIITQ